VVPKAGGLMPIRSKAGLSAFVIPSECEGSLGWVSPESKPRSFGHDTGLRMTNKGKPEVPPSLRSVRDDKHKRLARDDDEGFVILSECEGSRGWVSPESKSRSFGHDTGLRMTNKGKPEIPRSLRSLGTTNINGLFGTTMKALSSRGRTHEKSGESPAVAGNSPLLYSLFLWSVSILNT